MKIKWLLPLVCVLSMAVLAFGQEGDWGKRHEVKGKTTASGSGFVGDQNIGAGGDFKGTGAYEGKGRDVDGWAKAGGSFKGTLYVDANSFNVGSQSTVGSDAKVWGGRVRAGAKGVANQDSFGNKTLGGSTVSGGEQTTAGYKSGVKAPHDPKVWGKAATWGNTEATFHSSAIEADTSMKITGGSSAEAGFQIPRCEKGAKGSDKVWGGSDAGLQNQSTIVNGPSYATAGIGAETKNHFSGGPSGSEGFAINGTTFAQALPNGGYQATSSVTATSHVETDKHHH